MKVYCNGLLVFIGRQWYPFNTTRLIIGSGITGGCQFTKVKNQLSIKPYEYVVSNIKY